jgi:uncharacterized Zn-binding protein involved in type VI secretion
MSEMIRLGDSTTHGGKVLQGFPFYMVEDRPVSGKGHMVFCPLCKGVFPIVEGNPAHTYGDVELAFHGMRAACGATLLATQVNMLHNIASVQDLSDETRPPLPRIKLFDEQIQAVDNISGQPVAHQPYRLELADGTSFLGVTDETGHIPRTHTRTTETVHVTWLATDDEHDFPDVPLDDAC